METESAVNSPARAWARLPGLQQAATSFAFAVASARSWITVVGHQVELSTLTKLCRAARSGVSSELVLGTSALEQLRQGPVLANLVSAGVEVWHHPGELDGRLAISERTAVYRSGERLIPGDATELGLEVQAEDRQHAQLFTRYVTELRPHCRPVEGVFRRFAGAMAAGCGDGFCIRCARSIPVGAPYCKTDYGLWARDADPLLVEIHCHSCGLPFEATWSQPLCEGCVFERAQLVMGGAPC